VVLSCITLVLALSSVALPFSFLFLSSSILTSLSRAAWSLVAAAIAAAARMLGSVMSSVVEFGDAGLCAGERAGDDGLCAENDD